VVESSAGFEELKLSLEELKIISKGRAQSSRSKKQEDKVKLDKTELKINGEVVTTLEMNFSFEKVKLNDMWIVCYGQKGIKVYNWLQELFWKWEKEEVVDAHLEPTRLIFSTPSGKVCFANLLNGRSEEVHAIKDCSSMEVKVLPMPRLPSRHSKSTLLPM
jgi:hypothetical protein